MSDAEGDDVQPSTPSAAKDSTNSVDEPFKPLYTKLIEALCAEHGINLLKVDNAKKLGEWAGLCKLDKEGKARKVNACGAVVVKDYGKDSQALDIVKNI
ncbi:40S ribosomal protein S12 [Biomphalaria glabrata]|nr:40S ribosomal protein S12 [Biomphalaria glabrata]